MSTFLFNALTYLIAIGILVAVHEFGHFWVARRSGVKVLRFSIGFGKVLWSRPLKDGTEFAISAIPLGGYVSMLGENDDNVPARDAARSFKSVASYKRIAIMAAGPIANFIFAALVYWFLFVANGPGIKPMIGDIEPNSVAAQAGLKSEDVILEVGGKVTPTQEAVVMKALVDLISDGEVTIKVAAEASSPRVVRLVANDLDRKLTSPDVLLSKLGFHFWRPTVTTKIGEIAAGGSADKAGLKVGDEVLRFDGVEVKDFLELRRLITQRPDRDVALEVRRGNDVSSLNVAVGSALENGKVIGRMGVGPVIPDFPESMILPKDSLLRGFTRGLQQTWDKTVFVFQTVGYLIVGKISLESVSGPVGIATVTGEAARIGFLPFVSLLALVSISIGALNLLPIPVLDGGRIVFELAELLKGGPVSERAQVAAQYIGIGLLVLLTVLAFYNDIARLT